MGVLERRLSRPIVVARRQSAGHSRKDHRSSHCSGFRRRGGESAKLWGFGRQCQRRPGMPLGPVRSVSALETGAIRG